MFRSTRYKIQDTLFFQIRVPGGHDTTYIISTYTINKVKCLSQIRTKGGNSSKILLEFYIQFEYIVYIVIYTYIYNNYK